MGSDSWPSSVREAGVISDPDYERLVGAFYPSGIIGSPSTIYPVHLASDASRGVRFVANAPCLVRGCYWVTDVDEVVNAAANATGVTRYDLACLELSRPAGNAVRPKVVTGGASTSGPAPAQNAIGGSPDVWQFPLGVVAVPPGATAMDNAHLQKAGWWIAPPSYITSTNSLRPPTIKDQGIYEWETNTRLVSDGTKYVTTAQDSGEVNLAGVTGWALTAGYNATLRADGFVTLQARVVRTGATVPTAQVVTIAQVADPTHYPTRNVRASAYLNGDTVYCNVTTGGAVQVATYEGLTVPKNATVFFNDAMWRAKN